MNAYFIDRPGNSIDVRVDNLELAKNSLGTHESRERDETVVIRLTRHQA